VKKGEGGEEARSPCRIKKRGKKKNYTNGTKENPKPNQAKEGKKTEQEKKGWGGLGMTGKVSDTPGSDRKGGRDLTTGGKWGGGEFGNLGAEGASKELKNGCPIRKAGGGKESNICRKKKPR